ncbi:transferase [Natronomonas gomsonensis]|uniref:VirB4 family type IV secretion system protein n=1 Tax=Natronomonas gomsonensis TaxID=1046043 RepID=UPI00227BADC2|nr:transferase [Natronomonas gomsonensis]MCY4732832.1 transferase [Natronomonas gomsonensis]
MTAESALSALDGVAEVLPPVVSTEGLMLYGIGLVVYAIAISHVISWYKNRTYDESTLDELLDSETIDAAAVERSLLDDIAERQQDVLAPSAIEWESRAARVGEQWTSTLYIAEYPDAPKDGYLSGLFELTDVEFDLNARIVPKNQGRARDELQRVADDLRTDASLEDSVRGSYLHERADTAVATYKAVEDGQRVFDQELVVTVRADSREELDRSIKEVRATLREQPARLEPKTAICAQDKAIQTAAPIGPNELDRSAVALGGAVGALLSSPHNPTILEDGGIEFGVHKDTRSPVVIDPFAREDGYAKFTVGDPGSGKSFSSKQQFIRTLARDPDRIGVVLEPLNNWNGVIDALGGRQITVGGDLGLNPLEIKPMPDHVLAKRGEDASLLKERRNRVVSFFRNFFAHRGVELGPRRTTLERAIETAYERRGITDDVETHDRQDPTVRDVLDILEEMSDSPEEFVVRVDAEREKVSDDAVWLLDQLWPFAEGGQFGNLGRQSEFDIRDEKVLYLDLVQQGGSIGGQTSLLMELLISLVYERAKETDREVVFVIDEARYLMKDSATLEYLETIFRHHRHHDLSIQLITQTVDEFLARDISKIILDQCAIKQFHKLDGMDESIADVFGLNHAQMRYVQNAIPGGDERGYSQALVGVDGDWRGIEVHALADEQAVIENHYAREAATGSEAEVAEKSDR